MPSKGWLIETMQNRSKSLELWSRDGLRYLERTIILRTNTTDDFTEQSFSDKIQEIKENEI